MAVLIVAPLLVARLGVAPFDDPGEGMHAQIARELEHSGDPFALTLNGVRYVDKPPLLYALLAGAFAVAGPSEGAARAISAAAAVGAVAATAWLGARLLGPGAGMLAGLALASSIAFFAYGRYVRPETLFVAALAWGLASNLVGLTEGRARLVTAGLVAFGLAGLAKDPVGALAPPLVIGLALALAGRARPVTRWLPWTGVGAAILLAFGWWLFAEARTPGFAWYTIVDNHVLNVARERYFPDEDIPLSAAEFLAVATFGAAPWVMPAGATLWGLARKRAWRDPDEVPWTVLALWLIGVFGVTALSGFRLPHYGLPAYPAIALLAARGWKDHGGRVLVGLHAILFAGLATVCAIAWWQGRGVAGGVMELVDVGSRKTAAAGMSFRAWEDPTAVFGLGALVFAAGAVAVAASPALARRMGRCATGASVAAGAVTVTMLALAPLVTTALAQVSTHRSVRDIAREVKRLAGADDLVVHEGPLENSGAFEWYGGRRPVLVDARQSVLAFGAARPESRDVFWDEAQLRAAWVSERRVWVVTTRTAERSLVAGWPAATLVTIGGARALYVNRPGFEAAKPGAKATGQVLVTGPRSGAEKR
jgi:4-amino-4-deoxy-L-arabinose transferase-like glycosyltransferase